MLSWRQSLLVCLLLVLHAGMVFSATDRAIRQVKKQEAAAVGMENFYDTSAALVIGNGNYSNEWSRLSGALGDVDEVASVLKKRGFVVTLKKDLTKNGFDDAFLRFIDRYGQNPANRLLFYYSGHGHSEDLAYTQEKEGYLVMVDAKDPSKDLLGFHKGSVSMANLLVLAKRIRSRHVLFLFDSCFSGNILNARGKPTPNYITEVVKHPVRQLITAGSADEPVPDTSIFKTLFLDMLNGDRPEPFPDGYLTGEELGLYLQQNLPKYNRSQHPQYGKINDPNLDKGDFVFFMNPAPVSSARTAVRVSSRPERQAGSLTVRVIPKNATVKILNIRPKYSPGMALAAGSYHLEAALEGYQNQRRWVELAAGEKVVVDIRLLPVVIASSAPVKEKPSVPSGDNSQPATHRDSETGMEFALVKGGWLGVSIQDMDDDLAKSFDLDDSSGILITDVQPDSPAAKAGIRHGDVIFSLAGRRLENVQEMRNKVALIVPGTKTSIGIIRNGKAKNITVKIGKREKYSAPTVGNSQPATHRDSATGMEFVLVKGGCYQMGDTFGDDG